MPPPSKLHTYTHTHTPVPRVNSHLFSGSSSGSRHHHWRWQQPFSLSCPLLLFCLSRSPTCGLLPWGKKKSPRLHEHDEKGERKRGKSKLWSPRSARKYNRKGETICGEQGMWHKRRGWKLYCGLIGIFYFIYFGHGSVPRLHTELQELGLVGESGGVGWVGVRLA